MTPAEGAVALAAASLSGGRVRSLDLTPRKGEVLGLAGLLGSGAEDVPYLLFGALRGAAGTVTVGGRSFPAADLTPRAAITMGSAWFPRTARGTASSAA